MSGFYKLNEDSTEMLHGPNYVHTPDFSLLAGDKDEYLALDIFPMDGWYWFDTEDEARAFFGLQPTGPAEDLRQSIIDAAQGAATVEEITAAVTAVVG